VNSHIAVCHLIHGLGPGGAEHLLVDLAAIAAGAGLRLSVVSLTRPPARSYARDLEGFGVEVRTLGLDHRWDPRALSRGLAACRQLAPDVVHTHLKHADLVGSHVSWRTGLPMVSTLHLIEENVTGAGRVKRQLAALGRHRQAARVIAVSDAQRRWYLRSFSIEPQRVVVIRNGVRMPREDILKESAARHLREEWGAGPGTVVAVMVALMRPGKGHQQLLEAASRLRDDRLRFVLIGDGERQAALLAQADALGLRPDRVIFAGFRNDIGAVLAAADLVVHPTEFDALPTALIHALAAGCPAVASDVGGVPEVVAEGCGILVPAGDVDALAGAVADLAGDPDRRHRMRVAAHRYFAEEFSAEVWAGRLRALYDRVLERGP
jgi:glycosyltransferase involved in cell wall biosynthesis